MSAQSPEIPKTPDTDVDAAFAAIILKEFGVDIDTIHVPSTPAEQTTVFGSDYMTPQRSIESPAASWNGTKTNEDEAE